MEGGEGDLFELFEDYLYCSVLFGGRAAFFLFNIRRALSAVGILCGVRTSAFVVLASAFMTLRSAFIGLASALAALRSAFVALTSAFTAPRPSFRALCPRPQHVVPQLGIFRPAPSSSSSNLLQQQINPTKKQQHICQQSKQSLIDPLKHQLPHYQSHNNKRQACQTRHPNIPRRSCKNHLNN